MLAAVSAAGLLLSPAVAAPVKRKAPAVAVSFDPLSTFTPGADPKLAAFVASRGLSLTDFKFTPAAAKSRPSQVRVAIRARPDAALRAKAANMDSASPVMVLTPASYNLGAAVGWRRFAISGDVAKTIRAIPRSAARKAQSSESATRSSASPAASRSEPSVTIACQCSATVRITRST